MKRLCLIGALAGLIAVFVTFGCDKKSSKEGPPSADDEKQVSTGKTDSADDKSHEDEHDHDDDHHHHHGEAAKIPHVPLPADGKFGTEFTLDQETSISAIFADPEEFEGKKVLVSGKVEAQCRRRRGWFALSREGKRPWLRVLAAPAFTIHSEAEGMTGKAEGIIEIRRVSLEEAKHLAKAHNLFGGDESKITEPQIQVVLRASSAHFSE